MTDEQRIHLSGPPPACASCYGQHIDLQHVDFGAAYDGPVVEGNTNVALMTTVAIDDLIICEDCLGAAAKLLGYRRDDEAQAELESLRAQLTDQAERVTGALAYIQKMDEEMATRASLADTLKPTKRAANARA